MNKYYIDCREVGWEGCTFSTEADTVEQVVEQLTDHVRIHGGLRSFGQELYSKIRKHIRRREDGIPVPAKVSTAEAAGARVDFIPVPRGHASQDGLAGLQRAEDQKGNQGGNDRRA